MTPQFFRFLVAGGIAALANIVSRMLFSRFIDLAPAVVLAYCVGMLVAFVLMRSHVFPKSDAPLARQVAVFVGVNLAAVLQTLVVTLVLARWFPETIAHVVGVCVPVVTSYFGHRMYTFR